MHSHDYATIPIKEVIRETDSAVSLVFDVPADLADTFRYRPGQFLTLRLLVDGKYRHRCYSLASAPDIDPFHKVTVKRVDGGLVSGQLCSAASAGQLVQVQPPAGAFGPADLTQDLFLFAGGSGITPVLSILKAALAAGAQRVSLVYANRDEASVIFRDELAELSRRHAGRLTVVHWLETVQGLPSSDLLAGLLAGLGERDAYICGPAPFMDSVVAALRALGQPSSRIHLERFISLPDEEAADLALERADLSADAPSARLTVALDGETHEIEWGAGRKMLDVMIAAGIDAPYSCKVGGCSACMCRVTAGVVTMAKNLVLDEQEIAEGWVLACQAQAASQDIHCEFL